MELSKKAVLLLVYVNQMKSCIGEYNGAYYVIPSLDFNWDGRIDFYSQRVQYPESIQELVDSGHLTFGEHDILNAVDYATIHMGHRNRIHSLTDKGKKDGGLC